MWCYHATMSTVLLVSIPKHSNLPWKYRNENLFPVKHQSKTFYHWCFAHHDLIHSNEHFTSTQKRDLKLMLRGGDRNFQTFKWFAIRFFIKLEHSHQYGAILKRIWTSLKSNDCHCSTWNKVTKSYCCCTMQHRVRNLAVQISNVADNEQW